MKIAIVTVLYQGMIDQFYRSHPSVTEGSVEDHERRFEAETSLWAGGWKRALERRGHEVVTVAMNNPILSAHWARMHGVEQGSGGRALLERLKQFQPEIVWYDYFDRALLREMRATVPGLRRVLGWTGSALVDVGILAEADLVLSCAPEAVDALIHRGIRAAHLHHAFDPATLELLAPLAGPKSGLTFVGQIIRGPDLHDVREQLLLRMAKALPIAIHSPAHEIGWRDLLKLPVRQLLYLLTRGAASLPALRSVLERSDAARRLMANRSMPRFPYSLRLRDHLRSPVYGVDMLDLLHRSLVVLNVHANSSPRFASNMRLFETTGVGTCLVTERRENIAGLFEPGREIVDYSSVEECIEKARWLMDHPAEAEAIGRRAQQRVQRDHTFDVRAGELEHLIDLDLSGRAHA